MLTPLLLDIMATMGLHVFADGLYLSAEESSVKSSLPPTAYIWLLKTAQPRCLRRVDMGAIAVHAFFRGSYRSTVFNGLCPSDPPMA